MYDYPSPPGPGILKGISYHLHAVAEHRVKEMNAQNLETVLWLREGHTHQALFYILGVWLLLVLRLSTKKNLEKTGSRKRMKYLQGGSVTIASNNPPQRHGLFVTSKVQMSMIRGVTPYWKAARKTTGVVSGKEYMSSRKFKISTRDHIDSEVNGGLSY
ncbi:hypothetical protein F5876DRAFT_68075 [Lentinula aff. lateritia]|uniref:Uncharacterized protein n=1 Tax=Lentinula aff. lateritia TaxID=2804960 RepID=A0ACC1TRY1_9AGAR|nr:hypothetical protein F5876DRAFT_68075 [Lentinula aff. lateritia]